MYALIAAVLKLILGRHRVCGLENIKTKGRAVFVCNHAGPYGPLAIGLFLPVKFKPWVLYNTMTPGLCRGQLMKGLFGNSPRCLKPACRVAAFLIEPACLWVMRRVGAIPVHRGKREIFDTFRLSVEALAQGFNIVIFPERDEAASLRGIKDFYTGFVHLARKYFKEKGEALYFYPVYADRTNKCITIGKPEAYDPAAPFDEERARIAGIMMEAIRQFADINADINSL